MNRVGSASYFDLCETNGHEKMNTRSAVAVHLKVSHNIADFVGEQLVVVVVASHKIAHRIFT